MIFRSLLFFAFVFLLSGCQKGQNSLLITVDSRYDIPKTTKTLSDAFSKKGYILTKTTDHTQRAKSENIYLRPTIALTFDNPKVFSALLTCNPSLATDLPIRVSIYSLLNGDVKLSYTHPEYWSLKHNIKDKNCIAVVLEVAKDLNEVASSISKNN